MAGKAGQEFSCDFVKFCFFGLTMIVRKNVAIDEEIHGKLKSAAAELHEKLETVATEACWLWWGEFCKTKKRDKKRTGPIRRVSSK